MSIEQTDVVDFIGTDNESGAVVLTISDHLEWSREHLFLLQEKLNSYLAFIESGELHQRYPSAMASPVEIHVVCMYRPSPEAYDFLARAAEVTESAGIALRFGPLGSGYAGNSGH